MRTTGRFLIIAAALGLGCTDPTTSGEPAPEPTGVMAPLPSAAATSTPPGSTPNPAIIAPGGTPVALVTTPTRVCWSAVASDGSKQSMIGCAPKSGGLASFVVRDGSMHPGLAASGETLFYSTEGEQTVRSVPSSGGGIAGIVNANGPGGRFALSDGTLFWIDFAASALMSSSVIPSAGPATKLADSAGSDPELIAALSYTAYDYPAVFGFAAGVVRLRPSGGSSVPLSGACFYPMRLAASRERVFWSCEDNTFRWTSTSPGDSEHVTSDVFAPDIATNSAGDAFIIDGTHHSVLRLRAGGTTLETITGDLDRPLAISVDDGSVFVADSRGITRVAL